MTWSAKQPLDALVSLVTTIDGMGQVFSGVPLTLPNAASCYIAMGGATFTRHASGGTTQRTMNYLVVFAYQTSGNVAAAEAKIAGWIDSFTSKFYTDPRIGLGDDVIQNGTLDAMLADSPQYQAFAGSEFRLYPFMVTLTQEQHFPV